MAFLFSLLGLAAGISDAKSTPISRITGLLNGLMSKLEEDLKAETDLYDTYKCWYKTTTETKTASNDAAGSRVDSLKSYIADIEAGKIEFTTERVDLEKQINGLEKDLETAKTMRDNENKDYLAAKEEMEQAVAALDSAIKKIEEGTALAQTRSYSSMLSTRHSLQKSMVFARAFLDPVDQKVLQDFQQFLQDPNNPDWKKLNKKADFKMKYKASSGKILETLKKLRTQFQGNLDDATKQEADALASYETLSGSKGAMLDKAQTALTDMSAEGGARGVTKQQAQDEVDALTAQVTADTKFITEAETAFKLKEKEWEARKELRSKEILAMSQAIAILASDDAKDQFTKSFKSQGYLFLQEFSTQSEPLRRAKCAARLVRSLASKSNDPRLSLLAVQAGNAEIAKVITKIDEIVAIKEKEETEDLTKKQKCEVDFSDAASKSRMAALAMDTASEDIERAKSQVAELISQIKEQEEKKTGMAGQLTDLERQRKDENTRFLGDKVEDEKAIALVESALAIIKDWKNAKKAFLFAQQKTLPKAGGPTAPAGILPAPPAAVQPPHRLAAAAIKVHTQQVAKKQAPQFQVGAGEAPIAPPATWETAEYGGASGESAGIVGILDLVKADMKKDITTSETDEAEAVKDYDKTKADLETEIKACDTTISAYNNDKADKEKIVVDKGTERGTKKGELESQTKLYQGYKPGCDFLLVNMDVRTKARQIEIDGLKKAKAILQGASSLIQETC